MKSLTAAACFLGFLAVAPPAHFDGKSLWRHVEVLAADDMEGRGTGTRGLERAQAYVIEHAKKTGLAPAGEDGFLQPVSLARREIGDCSAALVRNEHPEPLQPAADATCTTFVDMAGRTDAPLVFLGYGLQVPEKNYDDFAGLDLKGKVAVTIPGVPEGVDGPLAAHSAAVRWERFRQAGLVGWIYLPGPNADWPALSTAAAEPRLHLTGDLDESTGARFMMYFNPKQADRLFAGSGHTASELYTLGRQRKPLPHFSLPVSIRLAGRTIDTPVRSSNVIGKLEGADPQLRSEYVVLSAHLDGLGIGPAVKGDRIYNGAIDNASGVAALLDLLDELNREGSRPKRSVLFAFFTAEEHHMLGSKYFVAHPTVDRRSIVADINVDGIQAYVPAKAILVHGEAESDLGEVARAAVASQGLAMDVDIEPEANRFTCCSDQANFVFAGIPAVKLNVGFPGDLNAEQDRWRRERYHSPFDDPQQPVDPAALAKFEEVARAMVLDVAGAAKRPLWKPGSFYNRYSK